VAGTKETNLILKSDDLGDSVYSLTLKGLPSTTQRSMTFKTALGSDIGRAFKFTHYLQKPTTYQCSIERLGAQKVETPTGKKQEKKKDKKQQELLDFSLESNTLQAPPAESYDGIEIQLNVKFEPSTLGESRAVLILSSPEAGEYQCMLYGASTFPQPKGPFKFGAGKAPPIEFKNPFFTAADYDIRIDNPSFSTSVKSPLKLDVRLLLSTGKLIVIGKKDA